MMDIVRDIDTDPQTPMNNHTLDHDCFASPPRSVETLPVHPDQGPQGRGPGRRGATVMTLSQYQAITRLRMACGFRVYVDRAMLLLSQRTMYLTKLSPTVSEISGQLLQPATTCYNLLHPTISYSLHYILLLLHHASDLSQA